MAFISIADPKAQSNDRYAGVNSVKSTGVAAARSEPGVFVAQQNSDKPTYVVNFNVAATAAMDIFSARAGANKVLRLRRVVLVNPGSATAAAVVDLALGTAALLGSGGSTAVKNRCDASARASGVTGGPDAAVADPARTGDTTQASGFVGVYSPVYSVSVPATAGGYDARTIWEDCDDGMTKPLTVSGTDEVLCLRTPAVGAGATGFRGYVELTLEDA